MVENFLTKALREKVAEAVKDYRLQVKNGESRPPQVVDGYLPPKRQGVEDDFPYIIVRAEGGKSEPEQTQIDVVFIIGCYVENIMGGHEDCINIMSRIKSALASMENGILDKRYVLQFPIEWELLREQPFPYWQLEMTTHWVYNTPQAIFDTTE